jgi:hypothetical protein
MSRHGSLKQDLEPMFPGASWHPWLATVPDKDGAYLQTKIDRAASIIAHVLEETTSARVSLRWTAPRFDRTAGIAMEAWAQAWAYAYVGRFSAR